MSRWLALALLGIGRADAAELTFTDAGDVTFHSAATLGDFTGKGPFTGHFDPVALKGDLDIPTATLTTGSGPATPGC